MIEADDFLMQVNSVFLVLLPILSVITYVLMGKAFSKIAQNENMDKPWLAWIPGVNVYLMIKLAGAKMWLLGAAAAGIIAGSFIYGIAGIVISAIPGIVIYYLYMKIFERYEVSPLWFIITVLPFGLFYAYLPYFLLGMIFNVIGFYRLNKAANRGPVKHRVQTKAFVNKRPGKQNKKNK